MMYDIGFEPRLEPPGYMVPECPVCRGECGYYYLDINRDIIGCGECHAPEGDFDSVVDAWEWRGV